MTQSVNELQEALKKSIERAIEIIEESGKIGTPTENAFLAGRRTLLQQFNASTNIYYRRLIAPTVLSIVLFCAAEEFPNFIFIYNQLIAKKYFGIN